LKLATVKDIDFLPQRIKVPREKKRNRLILTAALIILAFLAGLAVWIPIKLEKDYLAKVKVLDEKITELKKGEPIYRQVLAKQEEYQEKKQALDTLKRNDFKIIPFLEKVKEVTPPGSYISKISVTADEGANITFVTRDPVETAALVVGLRSLDIFKNVDLATVPFIDYSKPVQFDLRFKWAREKPKEGTKEEVNKEVDKGAEINAAIKEAERKIKP